MFDALEGRRDDCLLGEPICPRSVVPGPASPCRSTVRHPGPTRSWYVRVLESTGSKIRRGLLFVRLGRRRNLVSFLLWRLGVDMALRLSLRSKERRWQEFVVLASRNSRKDFEELFSCSSPKNDKLLSFLDFPSQNNVITYPLFNLRCFASKNEPPFFVFDLWIRRSIRRSNGRCKRTDRGFSSNMRKCFSRK